VSELLLAKPGDIDLSKWSVKIHGTKNKYRRLREQRVVLPLFRRLLKLSAPHVPFERWDNAVRDLKAACKRAQVPRVTPRDLRRTHGYILRARGVEPHLIGVSLGHRDSVMAERVYGKLPPDAFEVLMLARVGAKSRLVQNRATKAPSARKTAKKGAAS
jgi:integrase